MRVILLQDISTLGRKRDIKDVAEGYGRNFLIPRKLAQLATDKAVRALGDALVRSERRRDSEKKQYEEHVKRLQLMTFPFVLRMGEKGKAFGSVSPAKIREALAQQGIAIDQDWIQLDDSIKTTGEHSVKIKFPFGVEAEVNVIVNPE